MQEIMLVLYMCSIDGKVVYPIFTCNYPNFLSILMRVLYFYKLLVKIGQENGVKCENLTIWSKHLL